MIRDLQSGETLSLARFLDRLRAARPRAPFDPLTKEFLGALSATLMRGPLAARYPQLLTLGFWLRPASVAETESDYRAYATDKRRLAPIGRVLHFPPANVDTVFAYSWVLSLLVGNVNAVRLSRRVNPPMQFLMERIAETLAEARFAELREGNLFFGYEPTAEINREVARACDLRVIWGGDETVERLRAFPLAPHARDLSFPDRYSLAVLSSAAVAAADDAALRALAGAMYNDVFLFDQRACSSPRWLFWLGPSEAASARLYRALGEVAAGKGYEVSPSLSMSKLKWAFEAVLDFPGARVRRFGKEWTVVRVAPREGAAWERARELPWGGGMALESELASIDDLLPLLTRRDQTVTAFGLSHDERERLAEGPIDRIVPVGQALAFDRVWDGKDLLLQLSRVVSVR